MKKTKQNKKIKIYDFDEDLKKELKKPEFKKWYNYYGKQLEVAFAVHQLRKEKRLSQAQLAKKIGTTQSNVARMEAGNQNFTTDTLQKIAQALNKELKIEFV
ncbi:helix-turn-helix domain-containing protein [Patescibacteria group bacterium]|nr:helix-turn-helix domain-containing protein [Patescibacteria group bacterium]MBU4142620.1 helix-turn-helix domain-containing protein [Patescibacteria group bacterium]